MKWNEKRERERIGNQTKQAASQPCQTPNRGAILSLNFSSTSNTLKNTHNIQGNTFFPWINYSYKLQLQLEPSFSLLLSFLSFYMDEEPIIVLSFLIRLPCLKLLAPFLSFDYTCFPVHKKYVCILYLIHIQHPTSNIQYIFTTQLQSCSSVCWLLAWILDVATWYGVGTCFICFFICIKFIYTLYSMHHNIL